ncbi:MAG TPA: hypothetical protein DEV72_22545 [Ktedonobacter sp.]|jgi:hypothetical protein|nr:hypothetical protein [Ktedonobacter sp.]
MRFAVEYESSSGIIGLCLFSADDQEAAQKYVDEMTSKWGYYSTYNLKHISNCGMNELYQLYPGMNKRMRDGYKRRVVVSEGQG